MSEKKKITTKKNGKKSTKIPKKNTKIKILNKKKNTKIKISKMSAKNSKCLNFFFFKLEI